MDADDEGIVQHGLVEYSKTTQERWPVSTVFPFNREPTLGLITLSSQYDFQVLVNPGVGQVLQSYSSVFNLLPGQHFFMPYDDYPSNLNYGDEGTGLVSNNPADAFVERQTPRDGGNFIGAALLRQSYEWTLTRFPVPGSSSIAHGSERQTGFAPIAVTPMLRGAVGRMNRSVENQFQYRDYVIRAPLGSGHSVDSYDNTLSVPVGGGSINPSLPGILFTPEGVQIHRTESGYTTEPQNPSGVGQGQFSYSFSLSSIEWVHPPY
jgi:hypothetical protein